MALFVVDSRYVIFSRWHGTLVASSPQDKFARHSQLAAQHLMELQQLRIRTAIKHTSNAIVHMSRMRASVRTYLHVPYLTYTWST